MGKIHELLVLSLSLVWFAGATPEIRKTRKIHFAGKKEARKLETSFRDTGQVSLAHPAGQAGVYRQRIAKGGRREGATSKNVKIVTKYDLENPNLLK